MFSPQTLRNLFPHFRGSSPECHFIIETSPTILHRPALPTPLPPLLCFIFLHSMEHYLTCSFYHLSLPQVLRKYLLNEQKNEKLYKLNPDKHINRVFTNNYYYDQIIILIPLFMTKENSGMFRSHSLFCKCHLSSQNSFSFTIKREV